MVVSTTVQSGTALVLTTLGLTQGQQRALVLLAVVALTVAVSLLLRGARERWRKRRRAARAQRAEVRGADVLHAAGYQIEGAQVRCTWPVRCDGKLTEVLLIADYIVSRAGQHWVAEVKTGQALDLRHGPTRRQLLEYRLAFDVVGVLLVDAEVPTITQVEFPHYERQLASRAGRLSRRVVCTVAVLLVVALLAFLCWRL